MIDIFGGDDGALFTVASECDVVEARKEAIQPRFARNRGQPRLQATLFNFPLYGNDSIARHAPIHNAIHVLRTFGAGTRNIQFAARRLD